MLDCPRDDVLADFVEGRLAGAELQAFYEHANSCDLCTATVAAVMRDPSQTLVLASPTGTEDVAPNHQSLAFGKRDPERHLFGRYQVLEPLSSTTHTETFLVRDRQVGRLVVLSVNRAEAPDAHNASMLKTAGALAQLSHRNVVTLLDAGTHEQRAFMATEYLSGGTLGSRLLAKSPPWNETLDRFLPIAEGLAAVHDRGFIHGNVGPENVLYNAAGEPKLVNFGAPSAADSVAPAIHALDPGLSPYASPEQMRGDSLDARADLWSFCAALYEALYHELPFSGRTPAEVMTYIERGRTRPASHDAAVPGWLRQVLLRGLRHARRQRYATMDELIHDLVLCGSSNRRHKWRVAAVVSVVIGAGLLAAYALGDTPAAAPPAAQVLASSSLALPAPAKTSAGPPQPVALAVPAVEAPEPPRQPLANESSRSTSTAARRPLAPPVAILPERRPVPADRRSEAKQDLRTRGSNPQSDPPPEVMLGI